MTTRWTPQQANQWYARQPWLVGCNYAPRTAINQLEMWQEETFDPQTIDQELGWAASVGMNSVRVFLHDLMWDDGREAWLSRVDRFLEIGQRHGIGAMFVIFDSCWHPFPSRGRQPEPEPGVHNSGWVQSPGVATLRDPESFDRLEPYVTGVISRFRDDPRVQVWDLWNEPCNCNVSSYAPRDLGHAKADVVAPLLERTFAWARAAKPTQPLTSGIWAGDWRRDDTLRQIERLQVGLSDVVSFHNYSRPDKLERQITELKRFDRPLLCTEYMARGNGSTFEDCLPIFKRHGVAAYNWGLVAGRTQTNQPWTTWQHPQPAGPDLWHHELFHPDGRPYRDSEVAALRQTTGRGSR